MTKDKNFIEQAKETIVDLKNSTKEKLKIEIDTAKRILVSTGEKMDEIQDTINEKKVEADKNSVKEKNDESKNVIKFCNEQEKEKIKNSKENELKSMNDKNNCIMGKFCRYDTRSPIRVQNFKFFDRIFDPVKFIPVACLNLKKILK